MEIDNEKYNNDVIPENISVKQRLKYAVVALAYFAAILLSNLSLVFKPLYKRVYYGQANGHFRYGLGIILIIIFVLLINFILIKKLNITYKKDKTPLSLKRTSIIYAITIVMVFIISAIIGFEIKPLHDIGNNTTAFKIGVFATKTGYYTVCLYIAVLMIENFQYALDNTIKFKNKNINKYLPYGGLATMLTYGIYSLCLGVGGSLSVLYFFMILLYGEIYLLCNRHILSTCVSCGLIFVL